MTLSVRSLVRVGVWVSLGLGLGLPSAAVFAQATGPTDADGIPYSWIDAAPAVGKVRAINPDYAFVVVTLPGDAPKSLVPGVRVAFRRDGVLLGRATVDRLEDRRTVVVQVTYGRVGIGDAVILYPPAPPERDGED
jgi:hypothetical protein